MTKPNRTLYNSVIKELETFLNENSKIFPKENTLTIDLHCHDYNSDTPDELIGRILSVPETWIKSETLIDTLKLHNCNAYTITNHNNARSCYELQDKGFDILTGAEFSCKVPDYEIGIHVLTYGFTPEQESKLNKLRSDIYKFQQYTYENDLPTIWAHPLYHYSSKGVPPLEFFDKMSLIFERFEVLNGQRDSWQNMLVKKWIDTLSPELLEEHSKKFNIKPQQYCRNPYNKVMTGGSDSHMGMFAGLSGSRIYVPNLNERLKNETKSNLILESLKKGLIAPYGSHNDTEKMTITFLDYFCQLGINMKDPGLMRLLLHKGNAKMKLLAFALSNGFQELKRHKTTMKFLNLFHDCFSGKVPSKTKKLLVPKTYKQIFNNAVDIAMIRNKDPEKTMETVTRSIRFIYKNLNEILVERLFKKINNLQNDYNLDNLSPSELIECLELPSHLRGFFEPKGNNNSKVPVSFDLEKFFDGLPFPLLASTVILGSAFTSAKVMYNSRPLLKQFSNRLGALKHPERILWLTDTYEDSNGVSMVLKLMLQEIKKRNLPIDILVCSNTIEPDDHLIVVPALGEFKLPFYEQQPIRIPNILDIFKVYQEGEYDRIFCSTEGPMGLISLLLKNAFSVPAHFYIHTDWIMFAKKVLQLERSNLDRVRRMLRAFYKCFDSLFVLNSDQYKWLTSNSMGFNDKNVFLTAHWVNDYFKPKNTKKSEIFGVNDSDPVILFSGRVSEEKGVLELPSIYKKLKTQIPNVKLVIAGKGPAENELQKLLPEAIYLGWVDHKELPDIYSSADLLVLPSRFDTFGCVVLEALSCGLPVVAYKTKGPKDIINHGRNGYLVKNKTEMISSIIEFINSNTNKDEFKKEAIRGASEYTSDIILKDLLQNVNPALNSLINNQENQKILSTQAC